MVPLLFILTFVLPVLIILIAVFNYKSKYSWVRFRKVMRGKLSTVYFCEKDQWTFSYWDETTYVSFIAYYKGRSVVEQIVFNYPFVDSAICRRFAEQLVDELLSQEFVLGD